MKDELPARKEDIDTARRLENVDMLDIEELEQRRDNPGKAPPLLLQQGLSTDQKHLIDAIITEKTGVFVSSIKEQFNNMHLELIRNFMHQETEVRATLMKVARKNRAQK